MVSKENTRIPSTEFLKLLCKRKNVYNFNIQDDIELSNNTISQLDGINIINCIFEGELIIHNLKNNCKLFFTNCYYNKRVLLQNSEITKLNFLRCTFEQYFDTNNLVAKHLLIEQCTIKLSKSILFHRFEANKFVFTKNESTHDIHIRPKSISEVVISGGESKFTITFSTDNELNIINSFTFITYSSNRTDYIFRNLKTRYIHIKGELKESSFYLSDIIIKSGVIDFFSNHGDTTFNSLKPFDNNSILIIKNCYLGAATLSQTDYSLFRRIILENTNLINIIPVNLIWCEARNLNNNSHSTLREAYRQLKIVATRNEDIPSKLKFQKHEMHNFLKLLNGKKGKGADKFVLWTNYISNDFGLNWVLALYWLIGLSIIWYTATKYYIGHTQFDINLIGDEIGRFIYFINPAHNFDNIFDMCKYKGNALMFDGVSRITNAYFLYQFISAFRKYSKK